MSSAATNPRRRAARVASDTSATPSLVDSFQSMSIRKGDTFHPQTNTSQSSFWDPLESRARTPSMPSRSATSPQSLEDLLVGAGERRVAELFEKVDRAIAANSRVALGNVLSEPEVLPVPTFAVDTSSTAEAPARVRHHSHTSDSGLGSSVADSTESVSSGKGSTESARTVTGASPATRSLSEISDASDEERGLSKYAAEQIHKHIIKPILREDSLKEFHELIKTVPERIGDKEIKNLRDLEKTLIFLAPDYSRSPSKYLRFCERTIRVLHTTVTTLHESDQRAPSDRPYTQGYFFDLVEQIRRYAAILAVTREKQAKGEKLDAMDITENEKVTLHGGLTHNGKPAELVRTTNDGKVVSLASGEVLSETDLATSMKRPAMTADDEEAAMRSMARRKKNAKPEIHTCELCEKEFKRPCDLTKHVKTHERPWKCPTEDCKYHEYGWPTEKERDRHVNDKHSSTPSLYHCLFKPCPYTSKRESNCKQHMEKAHNWVYVRSKNNGKARASITRLPQGSVPPSPASVALTPLAPSPSVQSWSNSSRHSSMAPPATMGGSNYGTPAFGTPMFMQPSPDFQQHFNYNPKAFDFNDLGNYPDIPVTPAMSEESHPSTTLSSSSGLMFTGSAFDDASPKDLAFDTFGDYSFDMPANQYTPNSIEAGPSNTVAAMHTSPGAQLHQTFTADPMSIDGSNEFSSGPSGDFTLYGGVNSNGASGDMFQSLEEQSSWGNVNSLGSNFGAHLDSSNPPALQSAESMLNDLFPGMADAKPNSYYNGYL